MRSAARGLDALRAALCGGTLVIVVLAMSACGASTPVATSSEGTPGSTGAPPTAERLGPPIDPHPVPPAEGDESIAAGTECDGAGQCTASYYAEPPRTEADCHCRGCARHVVNETRLREISQAVETVCAAWDRTHDCPPVTCVPAASEARCVRGACVDVPIVRDEGPAPCRSPADCPRSAACVTAALGGDRGCTDETCCGTAECINGCASDADCPPCRRECRSGTCRNPDGAM